MMKKQLTILLFIIVFLVGNFGMVLATAPTAADNTITLDEDTSYTLVEADFGFVDVDLDTFVSITIKAVPLVGTFELNSVTVSDTDVIQVSNIVAGELIFTPAADANGASYASFGFTVTDSDAEDSVASNEITFDVTAVNDAPTFTSSLPADVTLNADDGDLLDLNFITSDIDGDALTLSMSGLPSTAFFFR